MTTIIETPTISVVFKNDGSANPPALIFSLDSAVEAAERFFGSTGPEGGLNDYRAAGWAGPFETVEAAEAYIYDRSERRYDQSVTVDV